MAMHVVLTHYDVGGTHGIHADIYNDDVFVEAATGYFTGASPYNSTAVTGLSWSGGSATPSFPGSGDEAGAKIEFDPTGLTSGTVVTLDGPDRILYWPTPGLPPGIELVGEALVGEPTTPGTYEFTLEVEDIDGTTARRSYSVDIDGDPPLSFTPVTLSGGLVGVVYTVSFVPSGGAGSGYVFSITSGTLPSGFSLSSGGVLTGTGTGVTTNAITVTLTDGVDTVAHAMTLTISGASMKRGPYVSAGPGATARGPLPSIVTLTGSISDPESLVSSYSWSQVSGPSTPMISNPTGLTTSIIFYTYVIGTYVFKLSATTATGQVFSTTTVLVPAPRNPIVQNLRATIS